MGHIYKFIFQDIFLYSKLRIYRSFRPCFVKIEDPFQESVVGEEGWMVDDGFLVPEQEFGVRSSRTSKKSLVPCNAPGTDLAAIVDETSTYSHLETFIVYLVFDFTPKEAWPSKVGILASCLSRYWF